MGLEWAVLGWIALAEALILLLVTLPGLDRVRKISIMVTATLLQPLMAVIPFCFYLLLDIYWKFERMPKCEGGKCDAGEQFRREMGMMKNQRNFVLVLGTVLLYWLLYCVMRLLVQNEKLSQQIKQLKRNVSD